MPLLIHSMAEFQSLILPVLDFIKPGKVVEIGSEHGGLTTILGDWAVRNNAQLVSIDPAPSETFRQWAATASAFTHIELPSLEAIEALQDVECWFIDGDHNWYTVYHELQLIAAHTQAHGKQLLVFLHDVGWPNARRDAYYAPERIPEQFRQPHSYDLGVTLDQGDLWRGGLRGNGAFAWATHEGGPRNGVLTAVEDFAEPLGDDVAFALIPGVFGLGILFSAHAPWARQLSDYLIPYNQNEILATLEEIRLRNYLQVIALQDRIEAAATPEAR